MAVAAVGAPKGGAPTTPGARLMLGAELLLAANGWWVGSILFLIIWILIAFWPARVAARKGHSFFLYFLFSLIFFPAALLVAYLVSDRTRPAKA